MLQLLPKVLVVSAWERLTNSLRPGWCSHVVLIDYCSSFM